MNTRSMLLVPGLLVLALLIAVPAPARADDGKEMTLQFQDAEIVDVVQAIAQFAKVNIILSPEVKGKITVSFDKVPWRKALETIVTSLGYELDAQPYGIYTIRPKRAGGKVAGKTEAAAVVEKERAEIDRLRAASAAAAKRLTDVNEQVASQKARLEDAKRRVEISRVDMSQLVQNRIKLDHERKRALAAKSADEPHAPTLRIYAVKDLESAGLDVVGIARACVAKEAKKEAGGQESSVEAKDGVLIVRAAPAVQLDLSKRLGKLRGIAVALDEEDDPTGNASHWVRLGHARKGAVTLGAEKVVEIKKAEQAVKALKIKKAEQALKAKKKSTKSRPIYLRSDSDGKITWYRTDDQPFASSTKNHYVIIDEKGQPAAGAFVYEAREPKAREKAVAVQSDKEMAARVKQLETRAKQLKQAAKLLQQAGDALGSKSAYARAKSAFDDAVRLRSAMNARRSKTHVAYFEDEGGRNRTLRAVESLRGEVRALRGEVEELNDLVRKLLARGRK